LLFLILRIVPHSILYSFIPLMTIEFSAKQHGGYIQHM
jgi:hypothetical protein